MSIKITPGSDKPLPRFRPDLEVYAGPDDPDGSPTYNVFDPVASKFYKISWGEALILTTLKPGMTLGELLDKINGSTTLQVTAQQVLLFIDDAVKKNLTLFNRGGDALYKLKETTKPNWFKWVIYHYLYIRIPLINPDEFLAKTLPFVKPLLSKTAIKIYIGIVFFGFLSLLFSFDQFIHTFTYFFNFQGLASYAIAITLVKVIHEFGHAYTAKYYGIRVPTMGIAFIVLWPVLYTDVTEGWKLSKRSQRLAISFAGIAVELLLAGLSTLAWAITEPGVAQSIFFIIASATWVSTIAVNLNPAMRWDGYYLLCDLWGFDNLQPRAFAITRWRLRKWLWGLNVPPPEELISTRREVGIFIYTFYTWIYRLVLYTTIAIVVYTMFFKILGAFLFILEVCIFIIGPFYSEARQLMRLKKFMKLNPRMVISLTILTIFLAWFILPYPHQLSFPAITEPVHEQTLYAQDSGAIEGVFVKKGDEIHKGQPIIKISSKNLEKEIERRKSEIAILSKQIQILKQNAATEAQVPEKIAELQATQAKLNSVLQQQKTNVITATVNGKLYDWDEDIKTGQNITKGKVIGKIADFKETKVIIYIPEQDINKIQVDETAYFKTTPISKGIPGTIIDIHPTKEEFLIYPQLASINKGPIPVIQRESKQLKMINTYYKAEMLLQPGSEIHLEGDLGNVVITGPWESLFLNLLRKFQAIVFQESNF